MQHENSAFRFDAEQRGSMVAFRPYDGLPAAVSFTNGDYRHAPDWYRQFLYDAERDRGLDDVEDLGSPGEFSWPLAMAGDRAVWQLSAMTDTPSETRSREDTLALHDVIRAAEIKRRATFASPLERSADAYLVQRGLGRTIVAGYPWFTDWGRDTFIAVRGLCLATGRLEDARDILVEWAGAVSEGMLPNRFPDHDESPEFNSVDASLWYVIAAGELLDAARRRPKVLSRSDRTALEAAILTIVAGHATGTRFGIRMDTDGLLSAGVSGVQLTWMDARVGDRVITPRMGKPVEIQALWLNALAAAIALGAPSAARWSDLLARGRASFETRFWDEANGRLYDVIDIDPAKRALVVGDCVGHGLAAATAMAQLRVAARTLLLEGRDPAETLTALDTFALSVDGAYCATMMCAIFDSENRSLTYSRAGHPPGLIVHADEPVWLDQAAGPPLSVEVGAHRRNARRTTEDGDLLVLYTDGLIERRVETLESGFNRLADAAVALRRAPVQYIADGLLERLQPENTRDDVVLVVKRLTQADRQPAPAFLP
jgi:hypothetical protein